jgi:hypothetical protein
MRSYKYSPLFLEDDPSKKTINEVCLKVEIDTKEAIERLDELEKRIDNFNKGSKNYLDRITNFNSALRQESEVAKNGILLSEFLINNCNYDMKPEDPHAELKKQYEEDAKIYLKPWENWQSSHERYIHWLPLRKEPHWCPNDIYRRVQSTININGFEVPKPLEIESRLGSCLYYVSLLCAMHIIYDRSYKKEFKDGLLHKTKEAAELHRKALLSFTTKETA